MFSEEFNWIVEIEKIRIIVDNGKRFYIDRVRIKNIFVNKEYFSLKFSTKILMRKCFSGFESFSMKILFQR